MPAANSPEHSGPVAIIGLGLIGGSLALKLRQAGIDVRAHDRDAATLQAAEVHEIAPYADLDAMLTDLPAGSIVVLATPLEQAVELLPVIAARTTDAVTVTDVVSVKAQMLDAARHAGIAHRFVGGHPMAGTTDSGFGSASATLLTGATWVVTVEDDTDIQRWSQVCRLALNAGGRVVPCDSEWHDHAAAWISHLPHVLAELLASNVEPRSLTGALAAGSYRDSTRVAATRPELVQNMLVGNRRMLTEALESFLDQLESATLGVRDGDVADLVRRGHGNRTAWQARQDGATTLTPSSVALDEAGTREALRDVGAVGGFIVSHEGDTVTALT